MRVGPTNRQARVHYYWYPDPVENDFTMRLNYGGYQFEGEGETLAEVRSKPLFQYYGIPRTRVRVPVGMHVFTSIE